MLLNVKSEYIIKIIFSHLIEINKLQILKYNKILQNKIGIKLINYKLFKGIYIQYKSRENVKEYYGDSGNLRYVGTYFNGKRNGKGIEYYENGKLMFKGEYLEGKRNGKGIEYYENGRTMFVGEYLKGKRNGKGIEYFCNNDLDDRYDYSFEYPNNIMFEGEYLNGIRWEGKVFDRKGNFSEIKNGKGNIKVFNIDGLLIFEGEYLNGKRNGKGKEYYKDKRLIFDGEFRNDKKWNGKGYDDSNNVVYELINGNGKIKEYSDENTFFEGEYINGQRNGKGKESYYWENFLYDGEFLNDKKNGKGKEYDEKNKLKYEGEYLNGQKNGRGKEYYINGELKFEGIYLYSYKIYGKYYVRGKLEYEGDYLYNKKWNGRGYDENGNVIYVLNNGDGNVKEYDDDGNLEFVGEYLNGKKSGKGKEYNVNGFLFYYGEYLDGKRWNGVGKELSYYYDEEYKSDELFLIQYEYFNGYRLDSKFRID